MTTTQDDRAAAAAAPAAAPAAAGTLTVRLFAAAAEAAGAEELRLELDGTSTLAAVVDRLPGAADDDAQLARVLARCSFLVNGVRASAETTQLNPGDQVDVLPPFAGG